VPSSSSSGLLTGAKAGIGVGVALGAIIAMGVIAVFVLRRKRNTNDGTFKAEMPASGALAFSGTKQDEKQYRKDVPSEMGTDSATQDHLVELPTSPRHSELHGKSMNEQGRIARADDRAAAGYDGAYRGNRGFIYGSICNPLLEYRLNSFSRRKSGAVRPWRLSGHRLHRSSSTFSCDEQMNSILD
jgi:hypothetical protein